jgi:hypothetical protein
MLILYLFLGFCGFIVFQIGFWYLSRGLAVCKNSDTETSMADKIGGGFGLAVGVIMMSIALYLGIKNKKA